MIRGAMDPGEGRSEGPDRGSVLESVDLQDLNVAARDFIYR